MVQKQNGTYRGLGHARRRPQLIQHLIEVVTRDLSLRAELPKIFAETGAIFVYATTEPQEALLLGGNTATLSEGRVTQFGPTVEVFRRPRDLITAQTFSDPPLNFC